jgi:carboxyl-terminal processing protease
MTIDLPTPVKEPPRPQLNSSGSLLTARAFLLLVVVASAAFLGGVWFQRSTDSPHNNNDFQMFWDTWDILQNEYYYGLPENKDLTYGAIQGLYAAAGDRYTFFVPPQEAEADRQVLSGEFGGIGAYVSQDSDGRIVISTPFKDFPADKAGLKANDVILAVDGTSLEDYTLNDAVGLLRGKIGSDVTLTVLRPSDESQFDVTLTRAQVELPAVESALYGDVGYVRLFIFSDKASSSLKEEIAKLKDQGATSLILDLRGNPGGLLDQAVGVADLFLGEGVVVTQKDRKGNAVTYRSKDGDLAEELPLVVLIDGGSASASEVVAGALKDRGRATLIGQTSYGKGSVQFVHDLVDGSQAHVTTALWFTPNETPIQGTGLTPDVMVVEPEEATDQDPYLQSALDFFKAGDQPKN